MEHSAEYYRIMKARKKREKQRRRRVKYVMYFLGGVFLACLIAMLALFFGIRSEHKKAVEEYNARNWTTVETMPGGKNIFGMADGVEFSYTDDGRYFDGITVDGVSIGGMTYAEARATVVGIIEEKLNAICMVVSVGNASLALSASDFNLSVNADEILDDAYRLGRENLNDYYANYTKQQEMKANPVDFHIEYTCDRSSIMKRVDGIAEFVNTEPVEPYVTILQRPAAYTEPDTLSETVYAENGYEVAYVYFHAGRNGFVLNEESMVDRIIGAFNDGDYDCVLTAELEDTAPEKTVSDIKENFKKVTSYTSEFPYHVGTLNRRRNIQKGAQILNGCEVKPGEEISFNDYIGPRTEAGGWLLAPGITGGKEYENSPGGGICQVSGTLYNALLQCGPERIKITQRRHHSWPSDYVPYGLDATVDTNGPDLKWKNVSEYSIYIFAYADIDNGKMYIYIFTKPFDDGSYYETWAETVETLEPEETLIIEWPTWPTGYSETIVKARNGYVAKAYLKHFDSDGNLIDTIYLYTDNYYPVRGEKKVGTGDPSLPRPTN